MSGDVTPTAPASVVSDPTTTDTDEDGAMDNVDTAPNAPAVQ